MNILTVKEVSEILKLGKNSTYALMKSKAFPSYRINNKLYVTEENLNKWLNSVTNREILVDRG